MKKHTILNIAKTVLPDGRERKHPNGMLKKKFSDRGINNWFKQIDREIEADVYAGNFRLDEAKSLLTPRR